MELYLKLVDQIEKIDPWAWVIILVFFCLLFIYLIVGKCVQIFRSYQRKNKLFQNLIEQYENENH